MIPLLITTQTTTNTKESSPSQYSDKSAKYEEIEQTKNILLTEEKRVTMKAKYNTTHNVYSDSITGRVFYFYKMSSIDSNQRLFL